MSHSRWDDRGGRRSSRVTHGRTSLTRARGDDCHSPERVNTSVVNAYSRTRASTALPGTGRCNKGMTARFSRPYRDAGSPRPRTEPGRTLPTDMRPHLDVPALMFQHAVRFFEPRSYRFAESTVPASSTASHIEVRRVSATFAPRSRTRPSRRTCAHRWGTSSTRDSPARRSVGAFGSWGASGGQDRAWYRDDPLCGSFPYRDGCHRESVSAGSTS